MNNKHKKSKVRNTKKWKEFRKIMYDLTGGVDAITGAPLRKGWQLHHLDTNVENYGNLEPVKFICVNRTTHEVLHWLFRYKDFNKCLCNIADTINKMRYYKDQGV